MDGMWPGIAGIGAVWGWLVAGRIIRSCGYGRTVGAAAMATGAVGAHVWWLWDKIGLLPFLASALISAGVHWMGYRMLQERTGA